LKRFRTLSNDSPFSTTTWVTTVSPLFLSV
jgi:hypothetical protein